MKIEQIYKILYALFFTILLGVSLIFGTVWMQAYRELKAFKSKGVALAAELAQLRKHLESKEKYLRRLNEDPQYFEWVARRRLGYVYSDEIVFRFEDNLPN